MCARHIYASWYKKWKGMNRKIQFWNTVKATFVEDFDEQLQKLESLGVNSSNDLLETPVECWSKAYFKRTSKCDVVENSMAETFNGWILEARCKPIITMLEEIRTMVNRMNVKGTWAETWRTKLFKRKYLASYNHFLQPVRGKKFWPKGLPSILPPKVKVQPGRPKKNRIKSKDEPKKVKSGKYTRAGVKMTCSVCKTTGHNKQKFEKETKVVTTRKLQQENLDASRKYKIGKTK
ncbi:hypothetical protein GQ457_11G021340 [Hibiscus cannabinus]